MARVRFGKWNMGAFRQARFDPVVRARIDAAASAGAAAAGEGCEAGSYNSKSRYRGSIIAVTNKAKADNQRNNTLGRVRGGLT